MSTEWKPSRRTVLRSAGVGAGTLVGASGLVTAAGSQDDDTETTGSGGGNRLVLSGITVPPDGWGTDISGYFIHLDERVDPDEAQVSDQCEFADWDGSATRQYDAVLIDRLDDAHRSTEVPVYVPDRVDLRAGALFVINRVHPCESGYTGIELENIGAADVVGDTGSPEGGATDADGPGFTLATGLAGVTGAGLLLRWLRDQD